MIMNEDLLRADLVRDEDKKNIVYKCPAGKNTIGVGRNIDDVGLSADELAVCGFTLAEILAGAKISDAACMFILDNDIKRCRVELLLLCPWWVDMPEPCQRGLMNAVFNLGMTRLSKFKKMLASLESQDYNGAAKEALNSAWHTQVPKRVERIAGLFSSAASQLQT